MIRTFARIWAKLSYRFQLESEAARQTINAKLAGNLAAERRITVAKLRAEADSIEARIKEYSAKEETGFWLCANGHERGQCMCALPPAVAIVHVSDCPREPKDGVVKCPECAAPMKFVKRSEMSGQEK